MGRRKQWQEGRREVVATEAGCNFFQSADLRQKYSGSRGPAWDEGRLGQVISQLPENGARTGEGLSVSRGELVLLLLEPEAEMV